MEEQRHVWDRLKTERSDPKTTFWENWKGYIFLGSLLGVRALISFGRGNDLIGAICLAVAVGSFVLATFTTRSTE